MVSCNDGRKEKGRQVPRGVGLSGAQRNVCDDPVATTINPRAARAMRWERLDHGERSHFGLLADISTYSPETFNGFFGVEPRPLPIPPYAPRLPEFGVGTRVLRPGSSRRHDKVMLSTRTTVPRGVRRDGVRHTWSPMLGDHVCG